MSAEERAALWDGVDRVVTAGVSADDLRVHRVHLLAARARGLRGGTADRQTAVDELQAEHRRFSADAILRMAGEAADAPFLLLKGPEVAAHYPAPTLRPYGDVDLLSRDPVALQHDLTRAGFVPVGPFSAEYYDGLHHLRPLVHPDHPLLAVEVHRRPNWVAWSEPPTTDRLFAAAQPSSIDVDGLLAPALPDHAVLLAAHAWAEKPLRRVLDLIDVLALVGAEERRAAASAAAEWDVRGVWDTTEAAARALVLGVGRSVPLRTWARDLHAVRDRRVFEQHVRTWIGPFWARSPSDAVRSVGRAVVDDLTPTPGETWRNKGVRMRAAMRHPLRKAAEHREEIGPEGIRPRFRRFD